MYFEIIVSILLYFCQVIRELLTNYFVNKFKYHCYTITRGVYVMKETVEKNKVLQIIGNNIKTLRLSKGMTQEQMAEKLDHSVNFVSLIELGKSGMSVTTMLDICNILNVDINCLFKGLLDYRMKKQDLKLLDNILSLSSDDRKIIENLIEHFINKNNK